MGKLDGTIAVIAGGTGKVGEGIVKVTGEVGSGKTMLCNMLQQRLPEHVETVYIANTSVSPEEILHAIAFELQLGVERGAGRLEVMQALQAFLVKRHAEGRRVVVFIEESQSAPLATTQQERRDDPDDQGGLEALAEPDDEGGEHVLNPIQEVGFTTKLRMAW
mgnify:CR=1 FL=1